MMMRRSLATALLLSTALILVPRNGSAGCVNKFVSRTEGNKRIVTLLTGNLTFDEAKALASAINAGQAPPVEWVTDSGRTVTRQFGGLKVVRPMPVSCEGKASGSVVVVTFLSGDTPRTKMLIKLDPKTTVAFDEQAD
jgi:hypothetical protein